MKATFLHLGDVHLGNEQYGRKERAGDFADAFHYAVQYAIQHGVDFIIIAGRPLRALHPGPGITFDQSVSGLAQLATAGVPLVAIAGNHDRARYGQEQPWLQAMSRQGYLAYLDAVGPEGIRLTPWSQEEGVGGYVELRGVRLVGFRYLGAATARVVEELAEAIRVQWAGDRPYTVAMIHGGMDGVVPNYRAEMTLPQLAPLQGLADYVALGHIHEHYVREEWVYNPGSLETWNATEAGLKRGFLQVEVDTSAQPAHRVTLVEPPRRPFLRYRLEVEPCRGPAELTELLRRSVAEWAAAARAEKPVVHLTLRGRLRFDRRELDMRARIGDRLGLRSPGGPIAGPDGGHGLRRRRYGGGAGFQGGPRRVGASGHAPALLQRRATRPPGFGLGPPGPGAEAGGPLRPGRGRAGRPGAPGVPGIGEPQGH